MDTEVLREEELARIYFDRGTDTKVAREDALIYEG